jgi:hypothetical protein
MDKIRELLKNPLYTGVAGAVVGVLFGLIILGWWLFPVQWVDGTPQNLRPDLQMDYLRMSIQSFAADGNIPAAQQHWKDLGSQKAASDLLAELQTTNNSLPENQVTAFMVAVGVAAPIGTSVSPATTPVATNPAGTLAPTATIATGKPTSSLLIPLLLLCVLLIVIGLALAYIFLIRGRTPSSKSPATPIMQAQELTRQAEKTNYASKGQEAPVAQFMTTYMAGDDLYDDSFSIDSPSGEFLGECGVGISETVGVGEPKKVAAFEVWLFDKNDIQTVTKVLMSPHAFDDPAIHQRLESKGEPVLTEPGKHILLETATLQLEARVVDMNYGQGAMPTNSYFDRLTLELAVWPKAA